MIFLTSYLQPSARFLVLGHGREGPGEAAAMVAFEATILLAFLLTRCANSAEFALLLMLLNNAEDFCEAAIVVAQEEISSTDHLLNDLFLALDSFAARLVLRDLNNWSSHEGFEGGDVFKPLEQFFWQIFDGLVLGCIETKFCKKMCV